MAARAEDPTMRLGVLVPRVFVVVLIALLATATITFAAETRGGPATPAVSQATAAAILLVPDVRGQAYVFAKSTLEEAGFSWRVASGAQGFAANLVSSQSPAPGTRVYDTGAPMVSLGLRANSRYPQAGTPENVSSFPGTPLRLVGVVSKPKAKPKAKPKTKATLKPKVKPAVKPKTKPQPKAKPAPLTKPKSGRPPAFVVPGAKPEPLDEAPLTTRAKNLDAWLSANRKPTDANVRYWLYQHAWIVTGARLGWWHGTQALETLIAVDRRVERFWGIGNRSERVARAALAEVRKKSR